MPNSGAGGPGMNIGGSEYITVLAGVPEPYDAARLRWLGLRVSPVGAQAPCRPTDYKPIATAARACSRGEGR
jgi:hypothetical protein